MHFGGAVDERIRGGHAVFAVGADRVGTGRRERGRERINAKNFPEDNGQILAIADDGVVTGADVVPVPAVA